MKKTIAVFLVLCLLIALLTGCGKQEPSLQETLQQTLETEQPPAAVPEAAPKVPETDAVSGELYDAGNVTVLVPEGWKGFPETDVFAEKEGTMNPDVLNVSKGGQSEIDLFTKPYVRINYYGPSVQMGKPDAGWYENVKDIGTFTAGDHQWCGFTCDSLGTALAILWCEEGSIQYQASITLGSGAEAISHTDADVQAILASVMPSDPNAASPTEPAASEEPSVEQTDSFWDGDWYGWWCIQDGTGEYEKFNGIAWDLYAQIEDYGDGTGYLTMWDTETSKAYPLVRGYINLDTGSGDIPAMTTELCTFFDSGEWLPNVVKVASVDFDNWYVDPASSTVSHFENMIEIESYYEDPSNTDNYFAYYMYLRPWGTDWADVQSGDTSGCIYSDMMPVLYADWYQPLMALGVEALPDCIEDGFTLIEGGAAMESEPYDGEPGVMELDALKEALAWVKSNQSYDNTYEQIAEGIGVPGLYVDDFENNGKMFCRYRWFADDDNRMTITFEKQADGTLTWNITAWDGLE